MTSAERAAALPDLPDAAREALLGALDETEREALLDRWESWARPEQLPPPGDWRVWLICAGRGFGKTRAGAEWVRQIAAANPEARIALVGNSLGEARAVMVEGESGLLACHALAHARSLNPRCGGWCGPMAHRRGFFRRVSPKACAGRSTAMPGVTRSASGTMPRGPGDCRVGQSPAWPAAGRSIRACWPLLPRAPCRW